MIAMGLTGALVAALLCLIEVVYLLWGF